MNPQYRLRAARREDRSFVRRLSAEAFARFGDYDRTLPEWMGSVGIRTVIAESSGEPIGFAMYGPAAIDPAAAELLAIAVSPAHRSFGVGTTLLRFVEAATADRAGPDGTATVHLTVAVDNDPARRLFTRAGYGDVRGRQGAYPGGQPSICMSRSWNPSRDD